MASSGTILSIAIPTKERFQYLEPFLTYFLSSLRTDFEIIIQDNSVHNEAATTYLTANTDSRIRYFHDAEPLSVVENCDRAIKHTTGEFVIMIGDDDAVSLEIFDFLSKAKNQRYDAFLFPKPLYVWPGVSAKALASNFSGRLTLTAPTGVLHDINVHLELNKVLDAGGTSLEQLPKLYHGMVKRSALQSVYDVAGSFFPGPSPDMANAVALAGSVKSMAYFDSPLIMSGTSKESGAGAGAAGMHIGEVKNQAHLPADTADQWSSDVPFYWSGSTIYAESCLKALEATHQTIALKRFNFVFLYARCLVFDSAYKGRIKTVIKQRKKAEGPLFSLYLAYHYYRWWKIRFQVLVHNRMKLLLKGNQTNLIFSNIEDSAAAISKVDELIKSQPRF